MTGPRNTGTPRRLRQSEQPKARRPQALHKALLLKSGTPKPPQPTIITMNTADGLNYLEGHGLADFSTSQLVVDGTGGYPRYGV